MNPLHMDEDFARSLRAELVSKVRTVKQADRKRKRLWIGAGAFAGVGLAGGIGAAAAGLLVLPGGDVVSDVSSPVLVTETGSGDVELGPPAEGVTHVSLDLSCLTAGAFYFEDGASLVCTEADLEGPPPTAGYSIPITPDKTFVHIRTDNPDAQWQLKATYVTQTPTEWALNAKGETYGVPNDNGSPDLVAVFATSGEQGYAYAKELDEASGVNAAAGFSSPEEALAWQEERRGKTFSVPVYESDGETLIGEFIIPGPPELADLP